MDDITTTNIFWKINIQLKTATSKRLPKAGLNCFDRTFGQGSTSVILLNFCSKNPPLSASPKRYVIFYKNDSMSNFLANNKYHTFKKKLIQ